MEKKLNTLFQLRSFRPGQRKIVDSVLQKNDVLAVMPTGGGKSLCFQLPAMIQEGITIVVSPLIALMNDQVKNLREKNIPAGCIHSGMTREEKRKVFCEIKKEKNYLLYLSPEKTQKENFLTWLKNQNITLFAIDESHCVSQWGHDFRPEYAQLHTLRKVKPEPPIIALTATATPMVKNDIIRQLGMIEPDQHIYGFYRPNLYYQVEFCSDEERKKSFILGALKQTPKGRVIIYCLTRKKTEEWASFLLDKGYRSGFYHAGLSTKKRKDIEEKYKSSKIRILTATSAFGMGIDHPDVRLVVHTHIPGAIEYYYQEIGRAGRDGQESTCLLLYTEKDIKDSAYIFVESSKSEPRIKNMKWSALNAITRYAEGSKCRHRHILSYFRDVKKINQCDHCDTCAPYSQRKIRTTRGQKQKKFS